MEKMEVTYEVTIFSGDVIHTSTFHKVYLTLVGKDGESDRTELSSWISHVFTEKVLAFRMTCPKPFGELLMIKLEKEHHYLFPNTDWFPAKVEVKSPMGDTFHFPIYQWITDCKVHCFREGKAVLLSEETDPNLKNIREQELLEKQAVYCWDQNEKLLPHGLTASQCLPCDVSFPFYKKVEMDYTLITAYAELGLQDLIDWIEHKTKWTSVDDIEHMYRCHRTSISDYVHDHWKEDEFFSYQFLNGVHPMLIQRCKDFPENLPVCDDMVFPDGQVCLKDEMERGNIFLCDYKILDNVETNVISRKQQYLAAPIVLLHKTPDDKMMPIAIQLKQSPSEDNPIFLPSDSEWDWLLAKTFVRSADFNLHELSAHLLRTHLVAEVFAVALLRHLPMVHPLYKLLIPHTRYTLAINSLARTKLISKDGIFTKFASSGGEGMFTIMERSLSSVTYRSLCIPDDIADRGLEDVPNFYYRDDGLKLWEIIHSFVKGIISNYYQSNKMVKADSELQAWVGDIFKEGFLGNINTGLPEELNTVNELIKFVTMVIFTCSAQHSAVNSGQYDFIGWMPNTPVTLELPPPTTKGTATEATILKAFPDIHTTVNGMATVWLLSKSFSDSVFLSNYVEERFTEDHPLQKKKAFKEELDKLSEEINKRNKDLPLPYNYLNPKIVENSVSI